MELKFRAWDTVTKEMYSHESMCDPAGDGTSLTFKEFVEFPLKGVVVMQFTGLHDKNGRDVFEGDILRTPHFKSGAVTHYLYHVVGWSAKFAGWFARSTVAKHDSDGCVQLWVYAQNASGFKVAGNVHANPDLLK